MRDSWEPESESAVADDSLDGAPPEDLVTKLIASSAESALLQLPQRTYPVAVVARRLGVASATLRTWARRHDLTASGLTAGGHRRYTDQDIARLRRVQQLYASGTTLDAAAALAISETPEQLQAAIAESFGGMTDDGAMSQPVPRQQSAVRELLLAATSLNAPNCKRLLERSIRSRGVVGAWDDVIVPALREIGSRWQANGDGVEVEHLISHCVSAALSGATQLRGTAINTRPVLLACTPNERHSLPLLAINAALAERQIEARMLGEEVPTEALVAAAERLGPAVVVVWAQLEKNAHVECLRAIPAMRPPVTVIPAGPGWQAEVFPEGERAHSLTHTVLQVKQALYL